MRYGATITFTALSSKKVVVEIYNCDGCKVGEYSSGNFQSGKNTVTLKMREIPAGSYFVKILHNGSITTEMATILQ
jgi:hypothetical protein